MPSKRTNYRSTVRTLLLGRDTNVSMFIGLVALLGVGVSSWWISSTIGADPLAEAAVDTWTGQSLDQTVLLATVALVTTGVVSAAINSGLVPTFLLVASPLFGAGLARYGTAQTVLGTTHVVSLNEAFLDGAGAAIVIGSPLAAVALHLGVIIRHLFDGWSDRYKRLLQSS